MKPGCVTVGILKWIAYGEEIENIVYLAHMGLDEPYMQLMYSQGNGKHYDYKVFLTTTQPNFGGLKYWFFCPKCHRRVGKLYSAPDCRYFLCRYCQNLTYTSCRESNKYNGFIIWFMLDRGLTANEVKKSLRDYHKKEMVGMDLTDEILRKPLKCRGGQRV